MFFTENEKLNLRAKMKESKNRRRITGEKYRDEQSVGVDKK